MRLQAYMVFKGSDRSDESSGMVSKSQASKFLGKARSGNSQYTSTNSSFGIDCSKLTEQDVQEEFHRLYTQLELLKEKNMRVGNRHLASKIIAMQDAASRHDYEQGDDVDVAGTNCRLNSMLCVVTEKIVSATETADGVKTKRQSVSFAQTSSDAAGSSTSRDVEEVTEESSPSKTDAPIELNNREERTDSTNSRNGRVLKSGHARTHGIVINLDDKSRFTEEVTV